MPLSFIAALLIIIYATLTPFHFHFDYLSLSDYLVEFTFGKKDPFDIIRNILLFLPFGFFLGLILDRRGWSKAHVFFIIFLSGLLLTLTVESLQQFLPYRQASIYDLIGNTLGAIIGLVCYRIWLNRHAAVKRIQLAVSDPFKVLAVLAIYILFLLLLASSMTANARIFGWDKSYHLMLGNEWTANRPWRGTLFDLEIFNEALDIDSARQILNSPELALKFSASLQAYYQLTGGAPFRDLVGKLPDLVWEEEGEISREDGAAYIDGRNWLATNVPISDLFEKFEQTSQLSVRLTASTADLNQYGPARILSISQDPFSRNLTIGQEQSDLIIRFRSPLTGDNGNTPQFLFPNFFTNSTFTDFVLTYDGLALNLVDSQSPVVRSIEMVPGVVFITWIQDLIDYYEVSSSQIPFGEVYNWLFRLLFYTIVLFPVGFFLGLRSSKTWSTNTRIIMMFSYLLLVPFLLELFLVASNGLRVRPLNIVTGMCVVAAIGWVIMPAIYRLFDFWGRVHAA